MFNELCTNCELSSVKNDSVLNFLLLKKMRNARNFITRNFEKTAKKVDFSLCIIYLSDCGFFVALPSF